jgi:hypothetical protein
MLSCNSNQITLQIVFNNVKDHFPLHEQYMNILRGFIILNVAEQYQYTIPILYQISIHNSSFQLTVSKGNMESGVNNKVIPLFTSHMLLVIYFVCFFFVSDCC